MNTKTSTIQTTPAGRRILNIQAYRNTDELKKAHTETKSWQYLYQVPRGMSVEAVRAQLVKIMQKQGQWYSIVYHVGNFVMAPAMTTQTLCICLEHIGDNGFCSVHGEGH